MSATTLYNHYDDIGRRCMIHSLVIAGIRRRIVRETIPEVCGTGHSLRRAWPELLEQLDRIVAALDALDDASQARCRQISDDIVALTPHVHALEAACGRNGAIRSRVDDLIQTAREDLEQLKEADALCDLSFKWLQTLADEIRSINRGARTNVR